MNYKLDMDYSPAGRILRKFMRGNKKDNNGVHSFGYDNHYNYGHHGNPFAIEFVDNHLGGGEHFEWDKKGNMVSHYTKEDNNLRRFSWTEDNRLEAVMDNYTGSFYNYDAAGERNYKLTGSTVEVYQNGGIIYTPVFDKHTLYASPLITINEQGYTKHYFVEGRRFLTNVGSVGGPNIKPQEDITGKTSELSDEFAQYLDKCFIEHPNSCDPYITEDVYSKLTEVKEIARLYRAILLEGIDNIPYYLHTDRLGSGTVVTNKKGDAVHILTYMPHGETLLDLSRGFETPYPFTGYEKDPESGLSYAGARYYNPKMRSFNSTDPLWWKSPDKTSYHYCSNNPIMRVDPDGREDKLVIVGRQAKRALDQMRKGTTMKLDYNERTGEVTTKSLPRTETDRKLYNVINSNVVSVEIEAENAIEKPLDNGRKINAYKIDGKFVETTGGIFGGNYIYTDSEGNKKVQACQYVCPSLLEEFDNCAGTAGQAIIHEATEAYTGALISIERNQAAEPAIGKKYNSIYEAAHYSPKTIPQPCEFGPPMNDVNKIME